MFCICDRLLHTLTNKLVTILGRAEAIFIDINPTFYVTALCFRSIALMVAEGTSKDLYFHRNLLIMTYAVDYVLWGYAKLIAWRETTMALGYHMYMGSRKKLKTT